MSLDATRWAWKQNLDSKRKIVLLSLADRAGEYHTCYPSLSRLMQDTGITRRQTVIAILDELEAKNLIRFTGKTKGNGVKVYELIGVIGREDETSNKNVTSTKNDTATGNKNVTGTSNKIVTQNLSVKSTNESTKVSVPFDDFWNLYDKKRGDKDKIEKKWQSLKDSEREAIMNHLPLYKKSQPNKKYRKDPATYLNNKSWNDEIIFDDGSQPVSHDCTEQVAAPVFDEVVLKTDPKVLAMIAAKRKGGSHGTA